MTHSRGIDVGAVLEAGRTLEIREALAVPDFGAYAFPAPALAAVVATRLGGALELKGRIDVEVTGECARCLDQIHFSLVLDVDERLEPQSRSNDPLGDSTVLVGDRLDLADLARQLIDSSLPLVLLCSETCRGLCTHCGLKADSDDGHAHLTGAIHG
jgi:uncharacterized protein